MATATYNFHQIDVFGPQNQQAISSVGDNQRTDALARRERRATTASETLPHRVTVRIPLNGESVELAYLDSALPEWAKPVLASLPDRWGATPGWDGYLAKPTSLQLVVRLLNILSTVMQDGYRPPEITPLADGGAQAEWHRNGQDLEIVVPADDEPSYYFFNHATGEEQEGVLEGHEIRIRDLIGGLG
jgi:hypothetical protein